MGVEGKDFEYKPGAAIVLTGFFPNKSFDKAIKRTCSVIQSNI